MPVIERTTRCARCNHISADHGMSGVCMVPDCDCPNFDDGSLDDAVRRAGEQRGHAR